MGKKVLIIAIVLLQIIGLSAQKISIYDNIRYNEAGYCTKIFSVQYESIGKTTLNTSDKRKTQKLKSKLDFIPTTSISFLYKNCNYYIPLYEDLLKFGTFDFLHKEGAVSIEVLFINGCYDNTHPFAIVRSVFSPEHKQDVE